ncbi:endolytic transglycosylase MltG [Salibaculum halophilum]|uniref:endolytic transglycosylase MltG n=1 Tax=Salibaculum halophilum TaxID=1914408 RepID=UPI000A0FFB97|nr:endolytic transglycosylase MltG [Salibaculum halophilum]
MWRHIASNALTFLIVLLFLLAGVVAWGNREYTARGPLEAAICLQVERGATMRGVSEDLAARGAISLPAIFRIGADYADKASQLKAGSFLVPAGASMEEITEIVTASGQSTCGTEIVYRIGVTRVLAEVRALDPETRQYEQLAQFDPATGAPPQAYRQQRAAADTQYRVVVSEGVTSWQVITALNDLDVLAGEIAQVPDEGSLAPDSYQISPGDEAAELITRMQAAQERILAEAWAERDEGLPIETPQEALILASIVEKETGGYDEVRQVASVFENRLERGMRLQTDPTVIYGITEGRGPLGRGLRQSELRAETDYNTYVNAGLPPTPIANPGRRSIEAVMTPAETDYIYFVAKTLDPRDGHNFATTLEEHNRNVSAYRALEAEQAQ